MARVHLTRQHNMGEEQVQQHIEELADKLAARLAASYQWQGDRLEFERKGASGYIRQRPGEIEIFIKLGPLLSPLKGTIERTVSGYLDQALS